MSEADRADNRYNPPFHRTLGVQMRIGDDQDLKGAALLFCVVGAAGFGGGGAGCVVGVEVLGQPVHPELLEADAAPEHEVDVELPTVQRGRVGEVPGGQLLVVGEPGGVVGPDGQLDTEDDIR